MDDGKKRGATDEAAYANKRPKMDGALPDADKLAAQIAEKKRQMLALQQQLQFPTSGGNGGAPTGAPVDPIEQAKMRARQLAERRGGGGGGGAASRAPASSMAPLPLSSTAATTTTTTNFKKGLQAEIHPSLTMDTSGRLDIKLNSGISLVPRSSFATTKANMRAALKSDIKQANAPKAEAPVPEIVKTPFFDPNLCGGRYATTESLMPRPRAPKGFKFVQKGTFVAQANQLRAQAKMDKLRAEIAASVKKAGLEQELELVGDDAVKHDPVPEVEWWDTQFLPNLKYDDLDTDSIRMEDVVTLLVQHPVPIQPLFEPSSNIVVPVMLTKKERKRARRLRRQAEMKERQEKIRLGLLAPEQAKMKLSNFMRVLGSEAIADPTKAEKIVRDQIQARQDAHVRSNEERQLTDEQKAEKKRKKFEEDTSNTVRVAVFRIRDLSHPSHRFKCDANAQQNNLTGVCLVHSDCNLVVVEGGPKGIERYKRLMLRRINWNDRPDPPAEGEEDKPPFENECVLVWDGAVKNGTFRGFRFKLCPTELRVKEALGENAAHYFDIAKNYDSGKSL